LGSYAIVRSLFRFTTNSLQANAAPRSRDQRVTTSPVRNTFHGNAMIPSIARGRGFSFYTPAVFRSRFQAQPFRRASAGWAIRRIYFILRYYEVATESRRTRLIFVADAKHAAPYTTYPETNSVPQSAALKFPLFRVSSVDPLVTLIFAFYPLPTGHLMAD